MGSNRDFAHQSISSVALFARVARKLASGAAEMLPVLLLAAFMTAVAREAVAEGWTDERTSGVFLWHADFRLDGHATLFGEMARLQDDLTNTLGIARAREPVHLYLFQRQTTYRTYLKRYFPDVPNRQALFVKGRGPGMVFAYRSSEFDVDLRHESTHALLHAVLPMVPLWLDEGLAEYFEVPPDERAHDNPHLGPTRWAARIGQAPSLTRLEQLKDLGEMGRSEYRQSWAWVHFLLHGSRESHDELARFLADIQAQTPPGKMSDRIRRRLPDVEKRFVEHFRRWER